MASRTLLEIAEEVSIRLGLPVQDVIFGSKDRLAGYLRMAAQDTIRHILRACSEQGTSEFQSAWTFDLKPGEWAYPLPPDYLATIPNTAMRGQWPMGILGPVSAETWQRWLMGVAQPTGYYGWRIMRNRLYVEPVPTAKELVQIEYISKYPVVADPVADGVLEWNDETSSFVPHPFVPVDGEIDATKDGSGWSTGQWSTLKWGGNRHELYQEQRRILPNTTDWQSEIKYLYRRPNFSRDTDISALSDDHVLSLGMTWRVLRSLRQPYNDERNDFMDELSRYLGDDRSGGQTICLEAERYVSPVHFGVAGQTKVSVS